MKNLGLLLLCTVLWICDVTAVLRNEVLTEDQRLGNAHDVTQDNEEEYEQAHLYFAPGVRYSYKYRGHTDVKDTAKIKVTAQISIVALERWDRSQHCQLEVDDYTLLISKDGIDQEPNMQDLSFDGWMSFEMSGHGEVTSVHYAADEDSTVVTLKKILLGTMSSRLMIPNKQTVDAGHMWLYQVNETGHEEGGHESRYQAEPGDDKIVFTKQRLTKHMTHADQQHTKVVHLHRKMHVPDKVSVKEHFGSPNTEAPGYQPSAQTDREALAQGNRDMNLPSMWSGAEGELTLLKSEAVGSLLHAVLTVPKNLVNDTLHIPMMELPKIPLDNLQEAIHSNMTCILSSEKNGRLDWYDCFQHLRVMMKQLSYSDLNNTAQRYLEWQAFPEFGEIIVDVLGSSATPDSLTLLTELILKAENPDAKHILRTLVHFVGTNEPPPEIVLTTLEDVVFHHPYRFNDTDLEEKVSGRALLVLGALVDQLYPTRPDWSQSVISRVEHNLGAHDPYHHREIRSLLPHDELQEYLTDKAVHLLTLGNAAMHSSYDYIVSYLNDTDAHLLLKCSALDAVAKYNTHESAELLLYMALSDEDENVRKAAVQGYLQHPLGGDIQAVLDVTHPGHANVTNAEHHRIRRGLARTLNRIWKGFAFKLQSPSVNWKKAIGGSALGASFGLKIRNLLDLKIAPLSGHLRVDVDDSAWATVHLGIIGINWDFFRAELCFKGGLEYEVNILKEFGFEDVQKFADLYNNVVKKVVNIVKTSIERFRGLVMQFKNTDFKEIISDLIESIKQLPKKVLNLPRIAKRIYKALKEYVDLPPVVDMVKNLIDKVTQIFKDIKNDVMRLYNAIVDGVTVALPMAWDNIKDAFDAAVKALKKILKNPKATIQTIGASVTKITAAVGMVIEAKNKILEANFFAKDNRPYWFNVEQVIKDIKADVQKVIKAVGDTLDWLKTGPAPNDMAKRFTGVDLKTMKEVALREIMLIVNDEIQGPLGHIENLLAPFLSAYDFFKDTVKNVKEGWELLVHGYQEGRTLLQQIFGPKINQAFPRKYLLSSDCGDGFWDSDGSGHYDHPGVDVEVAAGSELVAPFEGTLKITGSSQVTIDLSGIKGVQIILDNVDAYDHLHDTKVASGSPIGRVTGAWCRDDHVHVALRKDEDEYLSPERYMERRDMPSPQWVQQCDHYLLVWKGRTVSAGSVTKGPRTDDETPSLPDAPGENELDVAPVNELDRRKRAFPDFVDKLKGFAESLGLPDFSKISVLKNLFSFRMDTVTLGKVLDILDGVGLGDLKQKIVRILSSIESLTNREVCSRPDMMDDEELKAALVMRGKLAVGFRRTLEERYLQTEPGCSGMRSKLHDNFYCRFDTDCQGLTCCVDLKLFIYRHALVAFIRFDPCRQELSIGLGDLIIDIPIPAGDDFAEEKTVPLIQDMKILDVVQLAVHYKVEKQDYNMKVSLGVSWCSSLVEECDEEIKFLSEAEIKLGACNPNTTATTAVTQSADTPTVDKLLEMKIADVIKLGEIAGLDGEVFDELLDDLRVAFEAWLKDKLQNLLVQAFGNEFGLSDMCLPGKRVEWGPYRVVIYTSPRITFMLGPVPMYFQMGINGMYGLTVSATICVMSMEASALTTPYIGSSVWGALGVSLWLFRAELRLTGYLLTTNFPIRAITEFNKFPLEVRARMDLVMEPLRIELRALLIFELRLPWGKKIRKTLINVLLWNYRSRTIRKNIFNYNDAEPDKSPPDFNFYSRKCEKCEENERERRAVSGSGCRAWQLAGRHYSDPALVVQVAVTDDRSEVYMTICIGTYSGGCDVLANEPLGGEVTVLNKPLTSGVPLYVTVTAKNDAGMGNKATCRVNTYDTTLPGGRIRPEFTSTSNPTILTASALALDDSPLVETLVRNKKMAPL